MGRFTAGLLLLGLSGPAPGAEPVPINLPDPLTLEQAVGLADQSHPALESAAARLDEARAEQQRVDAIDNLKADLELSARLVEPSSASKGSVYPQNDDSWAKLRVRKSLYDFGRTGYLTEAADAQLRGNEWGLLQVRQQRRLDVMARFFDVLLADLEQARDNEAMAIAYVRMDRARNRQKLGQTSDLEVLRLESRYQELLRRQRTSQALQRASRSRLALALNLPGQLPANLTMPELPALARDPGEVEEWVRIALAENPGIQALRQEAEAARKRVEGARAGNGAVIRGEIEGAAYTRSLGGSNPFTAALVLEVPLSTGGTQEAEVARHRALFRQRNADLAERELGVRQAALDLWLELQTLQARRKELEALGDFRELSFDRSRALYEMEYSSDLGDAMTEISEVRLLRAENDFKTALAWARLDALAGRLTGAGPAAVFPDHSERQNP